MICVFFFSATFLKKSFFHSTPGPPDHKTNPKKSTPASWLTASASAQLVFFYSERPQSRRPEKPVGFVENLWDFDNDDAKNDRVAWPDMFQEDILWIFCIYIFISIYELYKVTCCDIIVYFMFYFLKKPMATCNLDKEAADGSDGSFGVSKFHGHQQHIPLEHPFDLELSVIWRDFSRRFFRHLR